MATHSNILAWRIPGTEELVGHSPRGHRESDTTEATWHACTCGKRGLGETAGCQHWPINMASGPWFL